MNILTKTLLFIAAAISLSGCLYGQCIDGPCAFERAKIIQNIKPYGAHWVKEGMTRESRRADSWACGAAETVHAADHVVFSAAQRDSVRMIEDTNDFGPDKRLLIQWRKCMQTKGYSYQEQCDGNCMYP